MAREVFTAQVGINQTESRPCKWCWGGPGKERAIEIKTENEPKTHTRNGPHWTSQKKKKKNSCTRKYSDILWREDPKLVNHGVKETQICGRKRNCKLEQTKQIYALCSGTVMVKSADCSVVVSHYIHQLECRTLKAPRFQTHTALE